MFLYYYKMMFLLIDSKQYVFKNHKKNDASVMMRRYNSNEVCRTSITLIMSIIIDRNNKMT